MALETFTATGTLCWPSGVPASGATLHVGALVNVRPLLAGEVGTDAAGPYPSNPPRDPSLPPPPAPVPLFAAPPGASVTSLAASGGATLSRVQAAQDGTFSAVLPTARAIAYAAGARTDADMDPARGGAYDVRFMVVFPDGRVILFTLDPAVAISDARVDISAALSAAPL